MQAIAPVLLGTPGDPSFSRHSGAPRSRAWRSATRQRSAIETFSGNVARLGDLRHARSADRAAVLDLLQALSPAIDPSPMSVVSASYGRVVLAARDDWTLAAIVLANGQQTHPHDHDGWGAVVTVQGLERDRRYRLDRQGGLELIAERDYPPGSGYIFGPADIHQPIGADPHRLTVALHFLVHRAVSGQAKPETSHGLDRGQTS